jgi:hypothetical protein
MVRLSFPQRTAALALAALLTVSWASAAPPSRQPAARMATVPESLLHQLWSRWAGLWSHLQAATLDAGCHADPSGGCASGASPAVPTIDAGCSIQPSGVCASGG